MNLNELCWELLRTYIPSSCFENKLTFLLLRDFSICMQIYMWTEIPSSLNLIKFDVKRNILWARLIFIHTTNSKYMIDGENVNKCHYRNDVFLSHEHNTFSMLQALSNLCCHYCPMDEFVQIFFPPEKI